MMNHNLPPLPPQDIYQSMLSNYISYDRLFHLMKAALYGGRENSSRINLFIDLNSFFKRIWDARPFGYKSDNVLAASVINACAHYRNYLWSRHMVKATIYLVWGYNTPPGMPLEYNAHVRERIATLPRSRELLDINKRALEFICPYLPEVYFIDGGEYEVSATIGTLMSNSIPNVILTKDVYAYQLVAYYPNTFVFRPKKERSDDDIRRIEDGSWVVTKTNLFTAIRKEMGYKREKGQPTPDNARDLRSVLALSGLRARHIKGITTFNKACEIVQILEHVDPDRLDDVVKFEYSMLYDKRPEYKLNVNEGCNIAERGMCLDAQNAAFKLVSTPQIVKIKSGIVDLYNPKAVQEISDKEFEAYPLELMEL